MHRRSFVAALAAMSAAPVVAQDATPDVLPLPTAVELLERYIIAVLTGENADLIADLFDAEAFDIDAITAEHVSYLDRERERGNPVRMLLVADAGYRDYGFAHATNYGESWLFMARASAGKIVELIALAD
jgi:hypothetical protein